MLRPFAGQVILRLDPECRETDGLAAPDQHYHRICTRCKKLDDALTGTRCTAEPIFEPNWKGYDQFRGYDYSHETQVVKADVVVQTWRPATVVATGARVPFEVGDRVFVRFDVGRALPPGDVGSPFRVVHADVIGLRVEEE